MAVEPQTPIFSAGLSSAFGNAGIAVEVRPIWAFCSSTSIFSKLQRCQATSFCASLLPSRSQGPVAGPQAKSKACPCYQSHLRWTSGDSAPSQEEVELELPHPAVVQNKQLRTEVEKKKCRNCSCNIKRDGEFPLSRFWTGVSALEAAPLSQTGMGFEPKKDTSAGVGTIVLGFFLLLLYCTLAFCLGHLTEERL